MSTGGYLPGPPLDNADLERLVGPLPQDILDDIEVQRRYWLTDPETGELRERGSEMAAHAARQALSSAAMTPDDVDLLIMATGSPDYLLPPMVNLVQEELGLQECATLDIRSGGAGVVQALDIARLYLERGTYDTAVVIGSEAVSPVVVPTFLGRGPDAVRLKDRIPAYQFGDGAGAMVLRAADADDGGIIGGAMACVGGTRPPGMVVHGGIVPKVGRGAPIRLDVAASSSFMPKLQVTALEAVLSAAGVSAESIDLCLIPEGDAGWIVHELQEAGLLTPEWEVLEKRVYQNLAEMGAPGCGALPLFLDNAWRTGRVGPGDRVLLLGMENTKWIYAGVVLAWTAPRPGEGGPTDDDRAPENESEG